MEKLPKIESSDTTQDKLPQKPTDEPEIQTWEDEGGVVKAEKSSKKEVIIKELRAQKKEKMNLLHLSIQNLDRGEPIDEFRDETRKVVYFDEGNQQYFIEKRGKRKTIGIGDIMSDYAWGIKYVPDGEMIEPAYRALAKRILTNETRRDIESIYDKELIKILKSAEITGRQPLRLIERNWKKWEHGPKGEGAMFIGLIAETVVRELLNRATSNQKLGFVILRANTVEDSIYKYDFKIRVYQKNRGVKIKQGDTEHGVKKSGTGIQFGLVKPRYARKKARIIGEVKEKFRDKLPVDDILLITFQTDEFGRAFNEWLDLDKPPGGPEQFLSRNLKIEILKAVTKDLVEISDKEIEKIFPKEGV